jgi:hypothetical protein
MDQAGMEDGTHSGGSICSMVAVNKILDKVKYFE